MLTILLFILLETEALLLGLVFRSVMQSLHLAWVLSEKTVNHQLLIQSYHNINFHPLTIV